MTCSEFCFGEEACAALSHRQHSQTIDGRIKLKAEEIGVTLPEEFVDANVVADDLAFVRQRAMERDDRIEQTINRKTFGDEIDAEVAAQKKISLARFDSDASGNAAAIEIPTAGMNVMFGDAPPVCHRAGHAFNFHDAIAKHQRLIRQTHTRRMRINRRKLRPEHAPDRTNGKLHAHVAIKSRSRLRSGGRNKISVISKLHPVSDFPSPSAQQLPLKLNRSRHRLRHRPRHAQECFLRRRLRDLRARELLHHRRPLCRQR